MSEASVTSSARPAYRARAAHLGPERRRPQVLDAAKEIALAQGIPAVTMQSVAERLGVTRPVVYACFSDRIEMLTELLAREEQVLLAGVLDALPTPGRYRSTQAAFIGGFQALLRTVADQPDTWRTLFDSNPDPAVAVQFGRGRRLVGEQFGRLIARDLRRWGTSNLDRKLPVLIEFFMSAGEGAVRSLLADGNTWTPDELGELIGRALYRAIRHA